MAAFPRVIVCAPFAADDIAHMPRWASEVHKICASAAESKTGGKLDAVPMIALRDQDYQVLEACQKAKVKFFPFHCRSGAGVQQRTLGRLALIRYAFENGFQIVWFIDPEISPPPLVWPKIWDAFLGGADIVAVAYAPKWAKLAGLRDDTPVVCTLSDDQKPQLIDPTTIKGKPFVDIIGAEFGCTAITAITAATVPLDIGKLELGTETVESESVGWFINARALGKKTKSLTTCFAMIAGVESARAAPVVSSKPTTGAASFRVARTTRLSPKRPSKRQ